MTIVDSARTAYRRRQLAGDRRAGIWARKKARRAQRTYLREHWRRMLLPVAVVLAVVSVASAVAPSSFESGFLLGGGLASLGGMLAVWVMQATGTAPTMMGDLAEQWTAQELRKLRREGWRVVNHMCLRNFDIDHVVVGPGGAFAIETKWSATPWIMDSTDSRLRAACLQVERNARDLRLWTAFNRAVAPSVITPVLILWGEATGQLENTITRIGSTTVVAGSAVERWHASLAPGVLDSGQIDAAWQELEKQATVRDLKENDNGPLPPSLYEVARSGAALIAIGWLGCLAGLELLKLLQSFLLGIPACLALALLALPGRRWKRGKYFSLAWQTGVGFGIVAVSAYALIH